MQLKLMEIAIARGIKANYHQLIGVTTKSTTSAIGYNSGIDIDNLVAATGTINREVKYCPC